MVAFFGAYYLFIWCEDDSKERKQGKVERGMGEMGRGGALNGRFFTTTLTYELSAIH